MAKIISIFNQAGGVMKTTLTMNLGYHLHLNNFKVLLVDIDPQASLTTFMGLEPHELEETVGGAILAEEPTAPLIHHNLHSVDLAPANITLSAVELQLASAMGREYRLKQALESVVEQYDFILIDCPPSLGILSILGLSAATHVLVPTQTHFKAFKGTELLLQTIKQVKKHVNPGLAIAGFVPTLFSNANQDKVILQALQEQLSSLARVYPAIPRATAFADAAMNREPLAVYQPKHPAIEVLNQIAEGMEKL
ncbi:ATPase involved in chromosome partitioning [Cylindrospermum stagnale PCC 7417]|uniref:ATPase involved in chromosome partitioning n=1 Tax=Cylindrospermum stagnale PCC 7417 TaxID=56107 RepID=K9X548_9NOST|nr:ParA family protein [Cylindrospermum stagnale]AFZ27229.1 ATPase involved in chromosome partitioning [Cylindrospermum stagnale PCC 7417]